MITGSGQDEVNFLHISLCADLFWIWDWNCVDDTVVFWMLVNCAFAALMLCFSLPAVSKLMVGKRLAGNTTGIADPRWPKGYSIPHGVMVSNKIRWVLGRMRWMIAPTSLDGWWDLGCFSFPFFTWYFFFTSTHKLFSLLYFWLSLLSHCNSVKA